MESGDLGSGKIVHNLGPFTENLSREPQGKVSLIRPPSPFSTEILQILADGSGIHSSFHSEFRREKHFPLAKHLESKTQLLRVSEVFIVFLSKKYCMFL